MHIIDLSHTIKNGMAVYPGDIEPKIKQTHSVGKDGFAQTVFTMSTHTGTHLDLAAHLFDDAPTLDWFGPDNFAGWGAVVDLSAIDTPYIDQEHLAALSAIESLDFVLLHTGHGRHWGTDAYYNGKYPCLTEVACRFLGGLELKGVGMDTPSPDPVEGLGLRAHKTLMDHGMIVVENLTNLAELPPNDFLFCCMPLKIQGGEGSPARAVGITF